MDKSDLALILSASGWAAFGLSLWKHKQEMSKLKREQEREVEAVAQAAEQHKKVSRLKHLLAEGTELYIAGINEQKEHPAGRHQNWNDAFRRWIESAEQVIEECYGTAEKYQFIARHRIIRDNLGTSTFQSFKPPALFEILNYIKERIEFFERSIRQ